MREVVATITTKGQITVPSEVRKHLGWRTGDKLVFTLADGHIQLSRKESVVMATAGVFRHAATTARSIGELRAEAERAIGAEGRERAVGHAASLS